MLLNPLNYPICFTIPRRLTTSAWHTHIPFAMFLVDVLKPDLIVELGTGNGDSYCAFCQAVKELGLLTKCYAIDTWEGDPHAGVYGPEALEELRQHHDPLYGNFSRLIQSTFDQASEHFEKGTIDLLHIDGYHTYEAMKQDFDTWLPKMSQRGVVLLHDTNVREMDFGAWKLWDELKSQHPHFEFLHGHGLGVLAVGKKQPGAFRKLLSMSGEDVSRIEDFFFQLGTRIALISKEAHIQNLVAEWEQELQSRQASLAHKDEQLKEKEETIQATDKLVQEKDAQLAEWEQELQSRQEALAHKNKQLKEKEETIQGMDKLIREKDTQLEEKEETIQATDKLVQEKDAQLAEWDHELQSRQAALAHKDKQLKEKEETIQATDKLVQEKDAQLAQWEQELQSRQEALAHKDAQLEEKEETIQATDKLVQEKDAQLAEWDHELHSRQAALAHKDKQLKEKEETIQAMDKLVQEKDAQLAQWEQELQSRQEALAHKDAQLEEKEETIWAMDKLIREKDAALSALEREIEHLRAFYQRVSRFWLYKIYRFFRRPWHPNPLEGPAAGGWGSSLPVAFRRWIGRKEPWSMKARRALRFIQWHLVPSSRQRLLAKRGAPAPTPPEVAPAGPPEAPVKETVESPLPELTPAAPPPPGQHAILVKRRNAAGDVLLMAPILRALKALHPETTIDVWTHCPDLLRHNPHINRILSELPDEAHYEEVLDLTYELTPHLNIVEAYALVAGVKVDSPVPDLYLTAEERAWAHRFLAELGARTDRPLVAIHPIAGWPIKHWPLDRLRELVRALEEIYSATCLILGDPEAAEYDFGHNLTGKTTIRQAAALIEQCNLAVAVDSSLMHVAYSLGVPVVSLFGCTDPDKILPEGARATALQSDILCRGCHHRQPIPAEFAPTCLFDTVRCMEDISVDQVFEHCRTLLRHFPENLCSIVIPSYNTGAYTQACLDAILPASREFPLDIIVVNDASTDETAELLEPYQDRITLITNETNQGFTKTVNIGARAARGKYLVILNNDTIPERGWLSEMVRALEDNTDVGIVGPKLLYPEGRLIQHAGTVFNEDGIAEHIYKLLPEDYPAANRPRFFRAITGACLLLEREYYWALGGFDESFRNSAEDSDLCFRILQYGKKVLYCPTSVVLHYEGVSMGLDKPVDSYNRQLLASKWPQYLSPDIQDYFCLEEIEAFEGRWFRSLEEVPAAIRSRYDGREVSFIRYPYRLELGCGRDPNPGYIHLDVDGAFPHIEYVHDIAKPLPFPDAIMGEVLANHVIEHISYRKILSLFKEVFRVLVPGGHVKFRTPDLQFISRTYLDGGKTPEHPPDEQYIEENFGKVSPSWWAILKLFSAQDRSGNIHYACYDFPTLKVMLERVGFDRVERTPFGREYSPGEIQCVAHKPHG